MNNNNIGCLIGFILKNSNIIMKFYSDNLQ